MARDFVVKLQIRARLLRFRSTRGARPCDNGEGLLCRKRGRRGAFPVSADKALPRGPKVLAMSLTRIGCTFMHFGSTRIGTLAFALSFVLPSSTVSAQAESERLWLECVSGSKTAVHGVKSGSHEYWAAEPGEPLTFRHDYCKVEGGYCSLDENKIEAGWDTRYRDMFVTIDRRTGSLEQVSVINDSDERTTIYQCRRIADPRPPRAF